MKKNRLIAQPVKSPYYDESKISWRSRNSGSNNNSSELKRRAFAGPLANGTP
jgi:hypothetical protein